MQRGVAPYPFRAQPCRKLLEGPGAAIVRVGGAKPGLDVGLNDPVKQRSARISCNSIMRQVKNLFSPGTLKFIEIEAPEKLPFDGVAFEPRQSMRYRGGFDVKPLIGEAGQELGKGKSSRGV